MSWNKTGQPIFERADWLVKRNPSVLIRSARIIDPASGLDKVADLLVEKGKITAVGKVDPAKAGKASVLDGRGKIVAPGLFDMHVHLREPGREDKETILSGSNAAIAGGFTGLACMPNTDPALDNAGVVRWVMDQAEGGPVYVSPVAAITRGRDGRVLTDINDLYQEGVRALSDDGSPLASAEVMRRALEYTLKNDLVITTHSEEMSLAGTGVMREGEMSTRLGLPGWPSLAESVMVARDVLLAGYTGARLHVGHISSAESVELVRWAKKQGWKVTCEATPHHVALTDEAVASFSGNFKMNPPLGSERDRKAVIAGLKDGTIDAIATDHAPHTDEEGMQEYSLVPNGVIGMETALGVIAKELVAKKLLDWPDVIDRMAVAPREILRLAPAKIEKGASAELMIIDPDATWRVDPAKFFSKAINTPFGGWDLPAKPMGVIARGWALLAPDGRMLWS